MHYSAKRGIAIACRPYVRLSVTLVDQDIRLEILETNRRTISPTPSLFGAQRPAHRLGFCAIEKFWPGVR